MNQNGWMCCRRWKRKRKKETRARTRRKRRRSFFYQKGMHVANQGRSIMRTLVFEKKDDVRWEDDCFFVVTSQYFHPDRRRKDKKMSFSSVRILSLVFFLSEREKKSLTHRFHPIASTSKLTVRKMGITSHENPNIHNERERNTKQRRGSNDG